MGGFAMIFACARCSSPQCFQSVNFFLQVKHLQTLSRARQPMMYDESLRWQHMYSRDEPEELSLNISTNSFPAKTY